MKSKPLNLDEIRSECAQGLIYYWLEHAQLMGVTDKKTELKRSVVATYEDLQEIKKDPRCYAIRIYFGLKKAVDENDKDTMEMILVPVDINNQDLPDKVYRCINRCPDDCADQKSMYFNGAKPEYPMIRSKCLIEKKN